MSAVATTRTKKSDRIDARLDPAIKARIQRAADLEGLSITDFVVSKVAAAAEETIREHEILSLSAQDSARFVEAVLNPPMPGPNLLAAAERYRALLEE